MENLMKKESENRLMPKTYYLNERCIKSDQKICRKRKQVELAKNSKNKNFERQDDEPNNKSSKDRIQPKV